MTELIVIGFVLVCLLVLFVSVALYQEAAIAAQKGAEDDLPVAQWGG